MKFWNKGFIIKVLNAKDVLIVENDEVEEAENLTGFVSVDTYDGITPEFDSEIGCYKYPSKNIKFRILKKPLSPEDEAKVVVARL